MLNTRRISKSTARSGVVAQLVTAFSSCFDDDAAHNSDGGVISGLTLDVAGQNLLAVDNDAGVVKVFDPSGRFKHAFGKGVLVEPWDVFVTTSGELTHAFGKDVLVEPWDVFVTTSGELTHAFQHGRARRAVRRFHHNVR